MNLGETGCEELIGERGAVVQFPLRPTRGQFVPQSLRLRRAKRKQPKGTAVGICFALTSSLGVSQQTPRSDGISDGILSLFRDLAYIGSAFPARLNIIARYVERMLSTSQDGYKPLK
jgi:hypothetical protein